MIESTTSRSITGVMLWYRSQAQSPGAVNHLCQNQRNVTQEEGMGWGGVGGDWVQEEVELTRNREVDPSAALTSGIHLPVLFLNLIHLAAQRTGPACWKGFMCVMDAIVRNAKVNMRCSGKKKKKKKGKRGLSYFQSASHVSSSLQSDLASLCNNIQREDGCWARAHGLALISQTEERPVSLRAACRRITYRETDLEKQGDNHVLIWASWRRGRPVSFCSSAISWHGDASSCKQVEKSWTPTFWQTTKQRRGTWCTSRWGIQKTVCQFVSLSDSVHLSHVFITSRDLSNLITIKT